MLRSLSLYNRFVGNFLGLLFMCVIFRLTINFCRWCFLIYAVCCIECPFFLLLFSWKEAIEVKDDDGFCMMKKLIEKLPEVAKVKNIMDTKK